MKRLSLLLVIALLPLTAVATMRPIEVHQALAMPDGHQGKVAALTLDACGGKFDADLIVFLVDNRIPATIFATKKWLDRNPAGLAMLKSHADLFDVENHGANHVPAVIGKDRKVYGIAGEADVAHLKREVLVGAQAVEKATGVAPRWYRGATAEYDPAAIKVIEELGYKVAGFSLNADDGATLPMKKVIARVSKAQSGDIIIAHVNKPASETAEGLTVALKQLLDKGFRFVRLSDAEVRPLQKPRY